MWEMAGDDEGRVPNEIFLELNGNELIQDCVKISENKSSDLGSIIPS